MRLFVLVFLALLSLAAAVPDAAIERSLKARVQRSKLKQDGLSFAVKNGIVEWQGQVAIPQRKGAATRMAKAAGAAQVRNLIRVLPRSAHTAAPARPSPRIVTVSKAPRP